jgi:hypothetical protein
LRLEDAAALRLPNEVDDEQITSTEILPQPIGRTPLITGFNIVTNLFRCVDTNPRNAVLLTLAAY